jgi:multicomponent Na+:H+ antiporter subunit E
MRLSSRNGSGARNSAAVRRSARSSSNGEPTSGLPRRWLAIWVWTYLTWIVLTWSKSTEQLAFGAAAAAVIAALLAPLGPVVPPWGLLIPRRLLALCRVFGYVCMSMLAANISLSRRIWSRSRPLRPGMVVVPTQMRSEGELTAIGVLTSLVVDNQLVDLDKEGQELQYHGVWVETDDPALNRGRINGPLEDLLSPLRKP